MSRTPGSILAHADAEAIVRRVVRGSETQAAVAAEYGCSADTVGRVCARFATVEERRSAGGRKGAPHRRGAGATELHADAESVVRRMLTGRATARGVAKEYACGIDTVNRLYRRHTTREQRERARRRKISRTKTGQPINFLPWNKGLSVLLSPATCFKKGEIRGGAAQKYVAVGTITVRPDHRSGKRSRWIKVNDGPVPQFRWKLYAVWLWEQANGPVPKKHRVVHRDGDTMNDEPSNLVCVSGAEFLALMRELDPTLAARQKAGWIKARKKRAAAERERAALNREKAAAEKAAARREPLPVPPTKPKDVARRNLASFLSGLEVAA